MQGFNMGRYVPPDLEGTTSGNKLHGKHPLGARARHLHAKGALIVRFELPFATWCTNCKPENIIGQGVRFNAEKKKVGNYYSTPIYSFRFRHSVCGGWIEIRTDPRNTEYVVTEGGRRRDFGVDEEGRRVGEIAVRVKGEEGEGVDDPFAKVEGKVEDKRVVDEARQRILELQRRSERDWEDPYEMSRRLRRGFRAERKELERAEGGREAIREKMSLGIEILDETEEDQVRAAMVDFGGANEGKDIEGVRRRGLFDSATSTTKGMIDEKGKKGGKRRAADVVAERKALFRSELTGNTRAAVDPFLNDSSGWRPEVKRRKGLVKPGAEGKKNDGGFDETAPDGSIQEAEETSGSKSQAIPGVLVDYGSDSE
ncbi:CWC16 protein [Aspergillus egyptiacus]|nr:CWC16 protein [Aspergillus egyptiacus]